MKIKICVLWNKLIFLKIKWYKIMVLSCVTRANHFHWLLSLMFKFKYNFTHFLFQSYQLHGIGIFTACLVFPFSSRSLLFIHSFSLARSTSFLPGLLLFFYYCFSDVPETFSFCRELRWGSILQYNIWMLVLACSMTIII